MASERCASWYTMRKKALRVATVDCALRRCLANADTTSGFLSRAAASACTRSCARQMAQVQACVKRRSFDKYDLEDGCEPPRATRGCRRQIGAAARAAPLIAIRAKGADVKIRGCLPGRGSADA